MISLAVLMCAPVELAVSKNKRENHKQKYTLKRRKKAGGTYIKRKNKPKPTRVCFKLVGIKYCKD